MRILVFKLPGMLYKKAYKRKFRLLPPGLITVSIDKPRAYLQGFTVDIERIFSSRMCTINRNKNILFLFIYTQVYDDDDDDKDDDDDDDDDKDDDKDDDDDDDDEHERGL